MTYFRGIGAQETSIAVLLAERDNTFGAADGTAKKKDLTINEGKNDFSILFYLVS